MRVEVQGPSKGGGVGGGWSGVRGRSGLQVLEWKCLGRTCSEGGSRGIEWRVCEIAYSDQAALQSLRNSKQQPATAAAAETSLHFYLECSLHTCALENVQRLRKGRE